MDPLTLIAAAAAGLWLLYYAIRCSPLAGCLAFLLIASCFGYPFLHIDSGPLPLTLDRAAIVLIAGIYIVQRGLGQTDPKPITLAEKLLVVFLAVLALSTFTHNWSSLPPGSVPPVWRLTTGFFFPAVVYWLARQSRLTDRRIGLAHGALACFGIYLAVTGLLEAAGQWSLVFPHYIADPDVGMHFGRARGPMVQAVSYGLCLGVTMVAGYLWRNRWNRLGQLFWLAVLPLQFAALYFSYTRSVWIGTALMIFVTLAFTLRGRWRPVVLAGMAAVALLFSVTQLDTLTDLQREGSATEARESAGMRASFTYVSWQMFWDRPLWGFGFGQFATEKLPYLSDRTTPLELELIRDYIHHNTYLSLLTETGLIGLGLFAAILACWIRFGWRLTRDGNPPWVRAHGVLLLGGLATYGTQMLFHDVSYTAVDNSLIFLLAGLASGLSQRISVTKSASVGLALPCLPSAVAESDSAATNLVELPSYAANGVPVAQRPAFVTHGLRDLRALRRFVQIALRRHPRLYAFARRQYGRLTFWLRIPHEPDFRLFAALAGERGLFLDVGANSGQSARSLRIFNAELDILSFEPNRLLEPELHFTRRMLGPSFRYRMHGLGSAAQRATLFVPVVGSSPQTPWATADRQMLERNRPAVEAELGPFEIAEVPIEICRGDDLELHPIAMKIDVEGLELDVLRGLEATLQRDEPLLLIERNSGWPAVAAWLEARGYRLWNYDAAENKLLPQSAGAETMNVVACSDSWLVRHPQVARLIVEEHAAANAPQQPAATTI